MHDIERPFRKDSNWTLSKKFGFDHPEFLNTHQEEGAEIAKKFLIENGHSEELANKVADYISKHEIGGDGEKEVLTDAGSLSFLEDDDKIRGFIGKVENGESDKKKLEESLTLCLIELNPKRQKRSPNRFMKRR